VPPRQSQKQQVNKKMSRSRLGMVADMDASVYFGHFYLDRSSIGALAWKGCASADRPIDKRQRGALAVIQDPRRIMH
jgi:hypothetical protein